MELDFKRFDLPAKEPEDHSPEKPVIDLSLMKRVNQKSFHPQNKQIFVNDLKKMNGI